VNVALIVEWLDAWRGGAETSSQQFIHHLIDLGVRLDIITRSPISPRPGMNVHAIRVKAASRATRTIRFIRSADQLARSLPVDLVHAITATPACDIYQPRGGTIAETIERNLASRTSTAARAVKRASSRFNMKQRWLLNLEQRMLTSASGPRVIAISDYVSRQLRSHYDVSPDRIHKIFNGVEPDNSDPPTRSRDRREIRGMYNIGNDEPLAIMVAHNFRLKGLGSWVDALTRLQKQGSRLRSLVIGGGPIAPWRRVALRRGLGDVLHFCGPSDRVRAFFHAADIFVHPTFYDPCSRVVLEAMVSGLAVVTTRYDGAAEMIQPGENGFVINSPNDIDLLTDHVATLVSDAGLRQRIGDSARQIAPAVSMRNHAENVRTLYEEVTNRRTGLATASPVVV